MTTTTHAPARTVTNQTRPRPRHTRSRRPARHCVLARYYDPTTGQFLTRDPAEAITRSAYGYAYNNPLNLIDPTGLIGFGDIASGAWHAVRTVVTTPVSTTAMAVNLAYGALPGRDVSCRWNGANAVAVCSGGPTILGAGATTLGAVINTNQSYDDFLAANDCRLIAHETKHTDQWAIFGPGFGLLDGVAAGADWAASRAFGWDEGTHNPFEIWAGLEDGGYR